MTNSATNNNHRFIRFREQLQPRTNV